MLFYYIRHGEPIYDPDMLTDHGKVQAEALCERLSKIGLSRIYSSTSNRAYQTALPTAEKTDIKPIMLDFANEHYAWLDFSIPKKDGTGNHWVFHDEDALYLFSKKEIRDLGDRWFEHSAFSEYNFEKGLERVYNACDGFFESLGYVHDRYTGRYKAVSPTDEKVALFAHQGFGLLFLSCLLDIPYPQICSHFDMYHTGVTIIDFTVREGKDYCIPKILTLSSDAHLYAKGIVE